jgi:hypothetical protein
LAVTYNLGRTPDYNCPLTACGNGIIDSGGIYFYKGKHQDKPFFFTRAVFFRAVFFFWGAFFFLTGS